MVAESSAAAAATGKTKKKKKKKGKAKAKAKDQPQGAVADLLKLNPALASEFRGMDKVKIEGLIRKLKLQDVATGLVSSFDDCSALVLTDAGATRPPRERIKRIWLATSFGPPSRLQGSVRRCSFCRVPLCRKGGEEGGADSACADEPDAELPDGPVQAVNPNVPVTGPALLDGFEWVTMDLTDDTQVLFCLSPTSDLLLADKKNFFFSVFLCR